MGNGMAMLYYYCVLRRQKTATIPNFDCGPLLQLPQRMWHTIPCTFPVNCARRNSPLRSPRVRTSHVVDLNLRHVFDPGMDEDVLDALSMAMLFRGINGAAPNELLRQLKQGPGGHLRTYAPRLATISAHVRAEAGDNFCYRFQTRVV